MGRNSIIGIIVAIIVVILIIWFFASAGDEVAEETAPAANGEIEEAEPVE